MQDESLPEEARRRAAPAPVRAPVGPAGYRAPAAPSSSRMFAAYLADIEQLLDAHRREPALREALDLPRLAIALGDPQLRCNREALHRWCEEWVRPPGAEFRARWRADARAAASAVTPSRPYGSAGLSRPSVA